MADLSTGNKRAPLADRKDDLYETPPVAVRALLAEENIPPKVWEPACGPGSIVGVLRESGRIVYASDLVDYGCPGQIARRDFLSESAAPEDVDIIITNPPFKLAAEFVAHGLTLVPRVVMLLRLAFIESERRTQILDSGQLARVLVFKKRLPMMHRHGWEGPKTGSGMAFAWFIWDRNHNGPTELRRIAWRDPDAEPEPIEIEGPHRLSARHESGNDTVTEDHGPLFAGGDGEGGE